LPANSDIAARGRDRFTRERSLVRNQPCRTVERHLSNIYAKLRLTGKAARAAAAARFSVDRP
jgi:hypothetical protein